MQAAEQTNWLMPGARASAASAAVNLVSLACFEVAERLYALDVAYVREIVRMTPVTPLPMSPALIEGVAELRDEVVPVIDLGRALGGEPCRDDSERRIAVLEFDELVLGLVVERATDVLSVEASALEDPPALASQAGYEAVRAVVRQEGARPVLVLSLEHIIEGVYRSGLPSEGESQ
jgi:purine-binding chemotaxis protein CheW